MRDIAPTNARDRIPTRSGELWHGGNPYGYGQGRRTMPFADDELKSFDLVVNATFELPWPESGDALYMRVALDDSDRVFANAEIAEQVRATASLVAGALTMGWRVLVHCNMGLNRSGVVCARALMYMGMTADDAVALLRAERHPLVLFNASFVRWLLEEDGTAITAETSAIANAPTQEELEAYFG